MEGGMTCVKYLMFFFNLLIFLAGAALLGVGIWVAVSADTFKQVISSEPLIFHSVYVIIAVGAALFLIGFLGCCGAVNENRCLLGTFFTLVLILFLLQIVGAILVIVFNSKAENAAKGAINETAYDPEMMKAWDAMQQVFECCGFDGPGDWTAMGDIPDSCCEKDDCNTGKAFDKGCKETLSSMFWIIVGIALGILVIELLAMIFACCLYRTIGEEKSYA